MTRLCRHCLTEWVESPFRVCEDCDEPRERGEWREEAEEEIKEERRKIQAKMAAQSQRLSRIACYEAASRAVRDATKPSLTRETEEEWNENH